MTEATVELPAEMFCQECGAAIKVKAEACTKSAVREAAASPIAPNGRTKKVAALLAFSLGSLGIHKFYLGQPDKGTLYCIFRWTFIPSVIAIIEGVRLLMMSDVTFAEKYGSLPDLGAGWSDFLRTVGRSKSA